MDLGLTGKAVMVVGGTRGMGLSAAEALAAEGARLVLVARDQGRLDDVAKDLASRFDVDVLGLSADASREGAMEEAVGRAVGDGYDLAGLVVAAGPMNTYGPVHTQDDAAFDFYYQNIFMVAVRSCRAILPHLQARRDGRIVTLAAYSTRAQKPSLPHYTAMKSAVVSLTKNISKAYGPDGIRANCVCPGMIETPLLYELITREEASERYGCPPDEALYRYTEEEWGMTLSLRRLGRPEEVGELAAFLVSDRAAYVTGATVNIDGGTDFF
ncbi:MAG TPA: SDR family oxidoreductase [Acidimicrobiia bacterium]|nr:SDR family oxidoreductase [Acidimicrobiia bacterium]